MDSLVKWCFSAIATSIALPMKARTSAASSIDQPADGHELPTSQLLFCIGLRQSALNFIVVRFCDLTGPKRVRASSLIANEPGCGTMLTYSDAEISLSSRRNVAATDAVSEVLAFRTLPIISEGRQSPNLSAV